MKTNREHQNDKNNHTLKSTSLIGLCHAAAIASVSGV